MAYTANLLTRSNLASHSLNGETVYLYGSSWTDAWYGSEPPDNALYELEVGEDGYKWTSESKESQENEWLAAHFKTKRRIKKVAFYFSYEPRYATNVTLQGSNDSTNGSDGTWATIVSGLDNTSPGGETWTVEHEFANESWYSWYRIVMQSRPEDDPPTYYSVSVKGWMLYGVEGEVYVEETQEEITPIAECIKGDMLKLKLDIYNPMNVAQHVRIDLTPDTPSWWPSLSLTRSLPLTTDILASYPFGGDYPISATLLNYDGTEDPPFLPGIVRVYDIPQIENAQATPTVGYGPTTVTFSWEPYEAGGILEYELDDGAGNITIVDGASTSATLTYQTPGTYMPRIRARMINGGIATTLVETAMSDPQYLYPGDGITGNGTDIWLPHAPIKPGTMNMAVGVGNISEWTLDHSKGHLHTSRDFGVFDLVIINGYTHYALDGNPDGWVDLPQITIHAAPGDLQWLYLTPAIGSGTSFVEQTIMWGLIPTAAVADLVTRFEIDWDDGSDIEQVTNNAVTVATHYYAVGDVLRHVARRDLGFQIIPRIRWVVTVDENEIAGDWFDGTAFYIAPAKPTISGFSSSKTGHTVPRLPLTLTVSVIDPDNIAESVCVKWGDGVTTIGTIPDTNPLEVALSHQYGSVGTYTMTISVVSDHYLVPDSTINLIVVADLLTEGMEKNVNGLTAVITHTTKAALDDIDRVVQIKWGDE